MLLLIACQGMESTPYEYTVQQAATSLSAEVVSEALDTGLSYLGSIKSSELYLLYNHGLHFGDAGCPGLFDAVFGSTGWNGSCLSNQQWQFAGRSQLLYFENDSYDEVFYKQYGYFITNAHITEPDGGLFLMEGYGDLRHNDESSWMELFGSFSYSGTSYETEWLKNEVSVSISKFYDPDEKTVDVNGGMSRYVGLPQDIAGINIENLRLNVSEGCSVQQGTLSILGAAGDRVVVRPNSAQSCSSCSTVDVLGGSQEVCWDLSSFAEVNEW